jgi:DNA-binding CsgD family transcriptional regulator
MGSEQSGATNERMPTPGSGHADDALPDPWGAALAIMGQERSKDRHELGVENTTYPQTTDQRTLTRRRRAAAAHARIQAEHERRLAQERTLLAILASGASQVEIARQMGISPRTVSRIWDRAQVRLETAGVTVISEYRSAAMFGLGVQLQQVWRYLLTPPAPSDTVSAAESARVALMASREARFIRDQMNRLQNAYPAIGVDVSGTVNHHVDHSASVVVQLEAFRAQRARQAEIGAEADAVDLPLSMMLPAPSTNGHAG